MDPFKDCKKKAREYIGNDGYEKAATDFLASSGALLALAKAANADCIEHTKKFMLASLGGIGDNLQAPFGIDDFIDMFGEMD